MMTHYAESERNTDAAKSGDMCAIADVLNLIEWRL
jgi:hypothetical protein